MDEAAKQLLGPQKRNHTALPDDLVDRICRRQSEMTLCEDRWGNEVVINLISIYLDEVAKTHARKRVLMKYAPDVYGDEAKKLDPPRRAYQDDAGIDLPTILLPADQKHGLTIYPGDRVRLHTGICVAFPDGYWGRIVHRSSTESRHRLRVVEGVIDQYRDQLLVQVHNTNSFPIIVQHGQRLAQLIVIDLVGFECEFVDELPPSSRGQRGFGSSGV